MKIMSTEFVVKVNRGSTRAALKTSFSRFKGAGSGTTADHYSVGTS
jgi:hypothetical protein